jgi:hypothetical protein
MRSRIGSDAARRFAGDHLAARLRANLDLFARSGKFRSI